ncbi:MAG: MlaD family protein [Salibacteraceae bacterium]
MKNNIRLGLFVIAGTVLLILAMYFIGDKQSLFDSTIRVKAVFQNVNGLQRGNNVRLAGIDIGTVNSVTIVSDSAVVVDIIVRENVQKFIKEDAVAIIGTDGLMGNKIVNIGSGTYEANTIQDGDTLETFDVLHTDEIFRTLAETNVNVAIVAEKLALTMQDIHAGKGVVGRLINDSTMARNLQNTIANIKTTSDQVKRVSSTLERSLARLDIENKAESALLMDSAFANDLRETAKGLQAAGNHTEHLTADLRTLIEQLNEGRGTAGKLLTDTAISHSLERSLLEIEQGAKGFNENMEALKHNILFRRYFKKRQKENNSGTEP